MRLQSRLFLLSVLLPAALTLGVAAEASAQDAHAGMKMPTTAKAPASAMHRALWSDPKSWPGGKVPGAGDAVTIGRDRNVVLDVSPPAPAQPHRQRQAQLLQRQGSGADDRVDLPARGELDIGSEAKPHTPARRPSPSPTPSRMRTSTPWATAAS
ncbi:MAG: hypothetical protein WDN45_02960 [Caulobacteraceae bacterium]